MKFEMKKLDKSDLDVSNLNGTGLLSLIHKGVGVGAAFLVTDEGSAWYNHIILLVFPDRSTYGAVETIEDANKVARELYAVDLESMAMLALRDAGDTEVVGGALEMLSDADEWEARARILASLLGVDPDIMIGG